MYCSRNEEGVIAVTAEPDDTQRQDRSESTADPQVDLAALRRELDVVDQRLRDALRDRLRVCEEVGLLKRRFDIPVMQPARVDQVTRSAREYATRHDLSPDYLEEVYALIIAETCRVEDLLVASDTDDPSAR
ncbi:chorismate mutase [Rhodococcus sp. BP-349]|uniref:chorismate mutase n=1 Tax=unclassified Rhodococcus (in: high G+C Gram-positive bacteria) TaxID=192944 RepID=UPI001C9B09BA|nr:MULTISPECIES: chorismate mutase [unclassified Rhodococcus (in: high G+C Gram-positive bacteria)]MBY6539828.1 chorismate mutase [Rhodococcus sp. BP-363]MBY6543844.1 chorismate mutase [Rhodococcus sp. BP-369]MBY6563074.1 chorismate mutase [Rhodococcus sp. BP-370]MBY6577366.1 chorismate mutase [Rhodococcus sp. BP-364]MBY6586667.1 chorismate mutase [Rhodococcus sp. BP-358]